MELIASLIVVPVVAALLLLAIKNDRARDMVAIAFAALIALCSRGLAPMSSLCLPNGGIRFPW